MTRPATLTALLLLVACEAEPEEPPPPPTDPALLLEGDPVAGEPFYTSDCGLCHGLQGEGTSRGSALVGIFDRRTDMEVVLAIRNGVGDMPAFDTFYTDQELADLLAWMRDSL
jgi:mono/diheme cytochrome c family protein